MASEMFSDIVFCVLALNLPCCPPFLFQCKGHKDLKKIRNSVSYDKAKVILIHFLLANSNVLFVVNLSSDEELLISVLIPEN